MFTSLAYNNLHTNKPSMLYNILEEYNLADIKNTFGLNIVEFMGLSRAETSILIESSIKINKEKNKEEEKALKASGLIKEENGK